MLKKSEDLGLSDCTVRRPAWGIGQGGRGGATGPADLDLNSPNIVLLRAEEVARVLRCSRSQVYSWIQTGAIPAVRFGKSVRIPAEEFRKWLAQKNM